MAILELFNEVKDVTSLREIDKKEDSLSLLSKEEIWDQITNYERQFGMTSQEFLQRMQAGTAPDTFETMYWMGLLQHLSRIS